MKTTKTFKSGNSIAVRLPKALGVEAGTEMRVREEQGKYVLEPVKKPGKIDISGFWGKAKGLKVPPREDFEERPSAIAARLGRNDNGGA